MRGRIGVFAAMLVAVGFASYAFACEKCIDAGYNNWKQCSSGYTSGYQSCSGGFGIACSLGPSCGTGGGGIGGEVESPDFSFSVQPCMTCTASEPDQGFVLHSVSAPNDDPQQQIKLTRSGRRK
jgi:hypothetical protein